MKKSNKIKVGIFALTALSGALTAMEASALCVNDAANNKATITLNQAALATLHGSRASGSLLPSADADTGQALWDNIISDPAYTASIGAKDYGLRYIYLNKFYADNTFTYSATVPSDLNPTNVLTFPNVPDSGAKTLPVVCSTPAAGYQTGNIITNYAGSPGATVKIGLAGLFKMRSAFQNPRLSLRWSKLSLNNTAAGNWVLWDNFHGKSLFILTDGSEVLKNNAGVVVGPGACPTGAGTCTLTLTKNLRFSNGTTTTNWGNCFRGLVEAVCTSISGTVGANWWQSSSDTDNNLAMTAAEAQTVVGTITVVTKY